MAATAGWSLRAREVAHDFVMELYEAVQLADEDALLVGMRAEAFRAVLDIGRRPDAVALDPLRAQERHVGGAGAHRRQRRGAVQPLDGRFDCREDLGGQPGWLGR